MTDLSQWDKIRNVLNGYLNGRTLTDETILEISVILGIEIETPEKAKPDIPDIEYGTVFTGFFGKCIALGKPDIRGHFFVYTDKGYRDVYHVSNVKKIHPIRTKQMQRVLSELVDNPDYPDKWYNKPIPENFRDPDEYTNPQDLYKL